MTKYSIGPFELDAEVEGVGLCVHMKVGYKVISESHTFNLSLTNPNASWSSKTIEKFSVSLAVSYDDAKGTLNMSATETYPHIRSNPLKKPSKREKNQTLSVQVLPKNTLGYLEAGLPLEAVTWMEHNVLDNAIPSVPEVDKVLSLMTPEREAALKALYNIDNGGEKGTHVINQLLSGMQGIAENPSTKASFSQVIAMGQDKFTALLTRVVDDPVIQAAYPSLTKIPGVTVAKTAPQHNEKLLLASSGISVQRMEAITDEFLKDEGIVLGVAVAAVSVLGVLIGILALIAGLPSSGASIPAGIMVFIVIAAIFAGVALGIVGAMAVTGIIWLVLKFIIVLHHKGAEAIQPEVDPYSLVAAPA